MNSFGLGLVLNFVDNASVGINRVTNAFQQMSQTADAMSGRVSGSIESVVAASYALNSVGTTLRNTGQSIVEMFSGASQAVINTGMQMMGYRAQLTALYKDDALQKMEEIKQYAVDSVFDIQSLIPAVTMMKAVGIEAMNEVTTSSGKATQKLLDYASDIAGMVPNMRNMYGTGVQAAMGAIKEYVAEGNAMSLRRGAGLDILGLLGEKKGATIEERARQVADLVEKLGILGYTQSLVGTPTQQLNKMQDVLFNTLSNIADSGVFEYYTQMLTKLATFVESITKDTELYNTVVDVLADTVVSFLQPFNSLLDFVIENTRAMLEWIKVHPVLTKNILLVTASIGGLLIVAGTLMQLLSTIGMVAVGLSYLREIPIMLRATGTSFMGLMSKALPFVALAGALYLAWTNNLFGIRDTLKQVFGEIFDILSLSFDAWGDNTLSEDNFQRAKELGILPFIESVLDLKYLLGQFTSGFASGFQSVFDFFDSLFAKITPVRGMMYDLANTVGTFFKDVFNVESDTTAWKSFGVVFGVIASVLSIAVPLILGAVKAFSLISGVIALVTSPVGLAVLAIGALVSAVVGLKYAWENNLGGIRETLESVFGNLMNVYDTYIKPFMTIVGGFLSTIVTWIVNVFETWLKPVFTQLGGFFSHLWTNSLQPLLINFGGLVTSIVGLVGAIIAILLDLWNTTLFPMINWLTTALAPAFNGIVQIILGAIELVTQSFSDFINGILVFLKGVIDFVLGVFLGNWDLAWQGLVGIVQGVWDTIVSVIKTAINLVIFAVNSFITLLYSAVAGVINGVSHIVKDIAGMVGIDVNFKVPEVAPQIPYLEKGGIATDDTLAVVGDGEEDEAILPLSNAVFRKIAEGITSQKPVAQQAQQQVQNDYSVTFSAGSIVIQLMNATEAELEKAAEKLMKIIERKQQLKAMALRTREV